MEIKTLRSALAVGVLALTSGYAIQASAAPSFTFTEYGGFSTDVAVAAYTGLVSGAAAPAVTPVYNTMSWVNPGSPQSSLNLATVTGPAALLPDSWTNISTLTHNNIIIPVAVNWGPQDIWGRFILTDNDGAPSVRLDSDDPITITFVETPNQNPCPLPNPNGSTCDDHFTFTAVGLNSLSFTANNGTNWLADFRLFGLTNAVQIANSIYTAESTSSHLDVQVKIHQIPEPATLSLLGLGLLGLGFAKRRQLNG